MTLLEQAKQKQQGSLDITKVLILARKLQELDDLEAKIEALKLNMKAIEEAQTEKELSVLK